jgi:hypothetical protein
MWERRAMTCKGGRLRELIYKKYASTMAFYYLAAKMCNVGGHALRLFAVSGIQSEMKYVHSIVKRLGLGADSFDTHFTCEKVSALSPVISSGEAPTVEPSHFRDAILHRLND